MLQQDVCVLHVTAVGDMQALETLCHTTQVIAAVGVSQVLLVLNDGCGADVIWSAALPAEVRPVPCAGTSIVGRIRALQREFSRLSRERRLYAVHLHGVAACLIGARALKGSALQGRVLYSPHLAHVGMHWTASLLGRLMKSHLEPLDSGAVTASAGEALLLSRLLNRSAEVLPHRVSAAFFEAPRQESARPNVVADGFGPQAVGMVSRLCVLLNSREVRVPFAWLAPASADTRAQLEAAGVEALEVQDDAGKAQAFSRASVYIHISSGTHVPLAVPQAMAAGVPCLASDTPLHRTLIRHGETGFICTSERDFVEKLVLLFRDKAERQRISRAARSEAERCYTLRHFERAILRAYGISASWISSPGDASPFSQPPHAH